MKSYNYSKSGSTKQQARSKTARAGKVAYKRDYYGNRRNAAVRTLKRPARRYLSSFALAQLNPFDPGIRGVKVPDENTAPSSAYYAYDESSVTTSTTNASCVAMFPSVTAYRVDATNNVAVSSWTWPAGYGGTSNSNILTSVQNNMNVARPVAHGVRLVCPLAPTSATGFVHVCLYALNDLSQTTWNLPTTVAQMTELPYYKRLTLAALTQTPLVCGNKFMDMTAFRYLDAATSDVANTANGLFMVPHQWMCILIAVEGAPSGSTCLSMENVVHYEGQAKFGSLNISAKPCPVDKVDLERTSRVVQNADPVVVDEPSAWDRLLLFALNIYENPAARRAGNVIAGALGRKYRSRTRGIGGVNNYPGRLTNG